jgi:anti-sigma factor (TIGR02949 family)
MNCDDVRSRLSAYLDDELPANEAQEMAAHLSACPDCAAAYEDHLHTRERVRDELRSLTVPDVLRARILGDVRRTPTAARPSRLWRAAAAAVLLLGVGSAGTLAVMRAAESTSGDALVAAHVRSLMTGHLTDVATSDQHTVKPWFAGKVDFSPAVPRLDSLGFELIGGRLDTVDGRPVAAIVYKRRQHMIDVFVWTMATAERAIAGTSELRGYNSVRWSVNGLGYDAVSDLNGAELAQFAEYLRQAR